MKISPVTLKIIYLNLWQSKNKYNSPK
jgi:hypothetical protein